MSKNNVDTKIEGGLILIKDLQCLITSEKVERSLANRLMTKILLRDSEKIQLEINFNGTNKQTIPSLATSSSDNTKKKVAWDEHIHFNIGTSKKSNELTIRCWNTSIKGFDGCLGEVSEDFDKIDESGIDNRVTWTLRDDNPKIIISFSLYFLSNDPPTEMKQFDDDSIRDKRIGMILINNIKYKNILGHSGSLEFILQKELNSSGHWHTIPIVYNSSQHQKHLEWKYPVAMFMIAGPDKLIIRFKHGIKGYAEIKISIGPNGDMKTIWPDLIEGECKNAGNYLLMEKERNCEEINVTFDISCHSIVTSKDIFKDKRKSKKPPPPPPPRRGLSYKNKYHSDQNINRTREPTAQSILKDHRPQEYSNSEHERQRKLSLQENIIIPSENPRISRLLLTQSFDPNNIQNINQQSTNHHSDRNSLRSHSSVNSSKISESSKQKISQQIMNSNLSYEPSYLIIGEHLEEEENPQIEYDSITSQSSSSRSQQNFSTNRGSKPLDIIKNNLTKNVDQHVKLGCSPPSLQDYQIESFIHEDSDGRFQGNLNNLNQNTRQIIPSTTLQDNEQSSIPQTNTIYPITYSFQNDNSHSSSSYIYNKYELISPILKSKNNKIYLGRHIHTSDKLIVKFYKSRSRWENETRFLKVLKSKLIVKLEEMTLNPSIEREYFIITRYFGKSLDEIAEEIYDNKTYIKNVLLGTCKAVEWCHNKGVVHMDLNPSNIICKDQKIHKVQLCGFEHSKNAGDNIYSDKYNQPLQLGFTSPELQFLQQAVSSSASHVSFSPSSYSSTTSSTYYTTQSSHQETLVVRQSIDIFSLGCIFYYLSKKRLLYNSEKELEQLNLTKVCEDIEDEQISILVKCMVAENDKLITIFKNKLLI
ncbi:cyclin-dependent kinase-like 5 isoform X3 [Rhizophagus clarus]|uniref:Cyclin-dependent kinase-like 5 isoform X3 n=1 Tax=Rhizophagus clarus TaxID=94130 RepID=A0A8H3QGP2_9GLOM|nr:cyclin-dependent kinase-like 5 isoform X3 [Rhizophagus clarus]